MVHLVEMPTPVAAPPAEALSTAELRAEVKRLRRLAAEAAAAQGVAQRRPPPAKPPAEVVTDSDDDVPDDDHPSDVGDDDEDTGCVRVQAPPAPWARDATDDPPRLCCVARRLPLGFVPHGQEDVRSMTLSYTNGDEYKVRVRSACGSLLFWRRGT